MQSARPQKSKNRGIKMCMVMKGYNDFADNRAKSFLAAPLLRQPAMNKIRLKLVDINQTKGVWRACI